jgi:hypothetical protein
MELKLAIAAVALLAYGATVYAFARSARSNSRGPKLLPVLTR